MNTPIHDFLLSYEKSGAVRCHMPGGKGKNSPLDITEINGADSLYECDGIIRESEENAARLFGVGAALYSCSGSTLAIQTMLTLAKRITGKSTVAAGRYSHKSLINTCILLGMDISWVYPESFLGTEITPEDIEKAIDDDTAAVFINSIDYYGGTADIAAISEVCRKKSVLLLVDNAHGAYKVFTGDHPIKHGADMTADSAHKTLPALTGAAYLFLRDSKYYNIAKETMALIGTSSPSYLILDSLDLCNRYIADSKDGVKAVFEAVETLKTQLTELGFVIRESDGMRIVIDAVKSGRTGTELAQKLRENDVECEMSDERYVVLLFSTAQPAEDFAKIRKAFGNIEILPEINAEAFKVIRPEKVMPPREAYFGKSEEIPTESAVGQILSGVNSPCPPCVPIVMSGERIGEEEARALIRFGVERVRVLV